MTYILNKIKVQKNENLILLLTLATISFADSYSNKPDVAPLK